MKKFDSRSYSNNLFRPRPEVSADLDNRLVVVSTPWGNRSEAEKAVQTIKDYYLSARGDRDSTSPFEFLTCLAPEANDLRTSIMLANDRIYDEENTEEYNSGCEVLAISQVNSEVHICQVGHPAVFLVRAGWCPQPVLAHSDLSFNVSTDGTTVAPLPSNLVGLHRSTNLCITTLRLQPQDKLVLVCRSHIPKEFYWLDHSRVDLNNLTKIFGEDNEQLPFWVAVLEL